MRIDGDGCGIIRMLMIGCTGSSSQITLVSCDELHDLNDNLESPLPRCDVVDAKFALDRKGTSRES